MGEVVVSCEAGIQLELEQTERSGESKRLTADGGGGGGGVRWERFLPKMAVRVLLVEADDSTRQIIAALLRKCSYRVAAVSDGLQAWEVLKGSPCNIDLILTEVELPSISGYALLTLIMEHEVCKNIPVIMMSSHDSISTVYKCMLKGATDFLVKPVRKNELKNLWQHVWRKQASSAAVDLGPPDESVQQMIEITSENNNATSNHSSGYMSCIRKNKECIEKGSDAQSSCTKPVESGTEGENIEHGYCLSQPKSNKCLSDDINVSGQEEYHEESMNQRANENETRDALENSSREAIDLIGALDNNYKGTFGSSNSNFSANKFDILPFLDLSLRRPHPSGSLNQLNDENPGLNHSDASAFSRYINKPMQLSKPASPVTCNSRQKEEETNSEKQSSSYAPDYNHVSAATFQTGPHPEISFHRSQNREISHPIPVRGIRFEENTTSAYNSVMIPSIIHAQSGSTSLSSPPTSHHTESLPQLSTFNPSDHKKHSNAINQKDNRSENMEDPSGNSNFFIGNKIHEESLHIQEGVSQSQRSMLREAALNKFRMKRKDRCFDKKVRYESRKKLAEQRPRVKGQFVRQAPNETQPGNAAAAN